MGELGRALAAWLLAQGINEDICGSTLEPRWMRGTDPHARPAGRASLVSITEGWPIEAGSGIRPNAVAQVNTLPAPPRMSSPPPVVPPVSNAPRPTRKTGLIAAGVALAAFALGWLAVAALNASAPPASVPSTGPAEHPAVGARALPEVAAPIPVDLLPTAPLPAKSVPSPIEVKSAAKAGGPKVSSPVGRAAVAAPSASRPASQPALRKPGAKPTGDLISPYQ
jgi:hypothetical protein